MENKKDSGNNGYQQDHVVLKRTLGLRNGIGLILGIIIGSGIFVSPKGVLQHTGSIGASLILWTLCGFVTLFGSLSYAEIASVIPVSGGPYAYTLRAFGNFAGFVMMWLIVMIRAPVGLAIVAIAFANYVLEPFFPLCEQPESAIKLIAAFAIRTTALNCISITWSMRLQDILSFMKIIALVAIIGTGIVKLIKDYKAGATSKFNEPFVGTLSNPGEWALGFYAGMFSFSGWYNLNNIAEEIKRPNRNLTLAVAISIPIVVVVYLLTNVAYFTALDPNLILESNAVAVTFGTKMFGVMAWVVPVFVALSSLGTINGSCIVAPRICFVAARQGHLPHILALVSLKYVTPITAVAFNGFVTVLIVVCSVDLYKLMSYFSFLDILMVSAPVVGLLYLKWKHPDLPRPVKVHNAVHLIFLCSSIFLLFLPFLVDPLGTFYGILMLLTGVPAYWLGVVWKNKPTVFQKLIGNATIFIQQLFFAARTDAFIIKSG